jgi:hypothetical protein
MERGDVVEQRGGGTGGDREERGLLVDQPVRLWCRPNSGGNGARGSRGGGGRRGVEEVEGAEEVDYVDVLREVGMTRYWW